MSVLIFDQRGPVADAVSSNQAHGRWMIGAARLFADVLLHGVFQRPVRRGVRPGGRVAEAVARAIREKLV